MQTLISLRATVSPELGRILSDYLALDRARILRRLMVVRFGLLAVLAASIETVCRGFSPLARLFTVALCLVPPLCARIVDLVREHRLWQRPIGPRRLPTRLFVGPLALRAPREKVVKSS